MSKLDNDRYGPWAVVTGASAGIGEEFARQLAASGLSVVLIARRAEKLEALAQELRTDHCVDAKPVPVDLTGDFLPTVRAATDDLDVGLLVNNAGVFIPGLFLEHELERELAVIDLNVRAPAILTHHFGRRLVARGRGGVVIVSSLIGFQGVPFLANYAATKAYDLSLAEALGRELAPDGVDVVALTPGGVRTEGTAIFDIEKFPTPPLYPGPVVARALASLGRRRIAIPGLLNRIMSGVGKLFPRGLHVRIYGAVVRKVARLPEPKPRGK